MWRDLLDGFIIFAIMLLLALLATACGREPLDQCVAKGTKCHASEDSTDRPVLENSNRGERGPIGPVIARYTSSAQGNAPQPCTLIRTSFKGVKGQ